MSRAPADLAEVLSVLRARRQEVRERFKVELVGVGGSLARGEARADSDVDVVVDLLEGASLFKAARVELDLEDALGRPVELVNRGRLRRGMSDAFARDLVLA